MNSIEIFNGLLNDYTLQTVALGTGILGIVSGVLGVFAVLRRQSLLGDAISHAALPGVVLAFLLTRSKTPLLLVLGAALAGLLAMAWMMAIIRHTRVKEDGALGIVLSVFFGLGLVLLTYTQRLPDARQAGLDHFLFGQAAALLREDIWLMAALGGLALLLVGVFWKEFKLLSFDREFGASLGLPAAWLDLLLTGLLVVAIVIGLQTVGVVLMSAMLIAPAAAARQWTDRLDRMVALSALFGLLAGVGGSLISSQAAGLSTGPVIVLCISAIVLFSLFFAPRRGLVWRWVRSLRSRRSLRQELVLADLYALAEQHADWQHAHSVDTLQAISGGASVTASLDALEQRGWVRRVTEREWALTPAGFSQAQSLNFPGSRSETAGGSA